MLMMWKGDLYDPCLVSASVRPMWIFFYQKKSLINFVYFIFRKGKLDPTPKHNYVTVITVEISYFIFLTLHPGGHLGAVHHKGMSGWFLVRSDYNGPTFRVKLQVTRKTRQFQNVNFQSDSDFEDGDEIEHQHVSNGSQRRQHGAEFQASPDVVIRRIHEETASVPFKYSEFRTWCESGLLVPCPLRKGDVRKILLFYKLEQRLFTDTSISVGPETVLSTDS